MDSVFGVDGSYRVGPSPFLAGNECRGSPMEQIVAAVRHYI